MHFTVLKTKFILGLICLFLYAEGTFHKSWERNKESINAPSVLQVSTRPNGFSLTGYLASIVDYSYVILEQWGNRKTQQVRKRGVDEYPYGSLSLKDSLTVTPREYSKKELRELKKIVSLRPETVVVLTVFDKTYIPCESEYARTGSEIIIHSSYETISRNAEIALVKDPLTNDFGIKIPNIGPVSIESDEPILCHVAGYGALKLNRTVYSHPTLSVIDVEVFASNTCQTISRTYNVTIDADPSGYVCSYNRKYRYGSPLSQGDSGAPLVCDGNIVGVSQWVFSPFPAYLFFGPSQPTPHVYTKLGDYLPWILNHTEKIHDKVIMLRKSEKENASALSGLDSRIIGFIIVIQYYLNKL